MLVIVGMRAEAQDLRSQMGIGSESHCLFGQFDRILEISDSDAGRKVLKSGGSDGGQGTCRERMAALLASERRRLDTLSAKKEAKLSASDVTVVTEGKGDGDLRCIGC